MRTSEVAERGADPSDAELKLLKLFWRDGAMSVREAHERAGPQLGWAISTTRTAVERMRAKGLLKRRNLHGVAVYSASRSKVEVVAGILQRLRGMLDLNRDLPASAFSGGQLLSESELAEVDRLLASENDA